MIRQSEAAECGLACPTMVMGHHGHDVNLSALRRRFSASMIGMMIKTIAMMDRMVGLSARGMRLETSL